MSSYGNMNATFDWSFMSVNGTFYLWLMFGLVNFVLNLLLSNKGKLLISRCSLLKIALNQF